MIGLGLHLRNDGPPSDDDWRDIAEWQPKVLIVTEPYIGTIPELRRLVPGVYIVLRLYGAGGVYDGWNLPWQDADRLKLLSRFIDFGARSAKWLQQHPVDWMPDTVVWANEPSIEWARWSANDAGYEGLRDTSKGFLIGWEGTTSIPLSPVPVSPGQHFDDDPGDTVSPGVLPDVIGADIIRDVWLAHSGPWVGHNYGPNDTYHGFRFWAELNAIGWLSRAGDRRWLVSEYNGGNGDEHYQAELLRGWYRGETPPGCIGGAWFILDSGDHKFDQWNARKQGAIREALAGIAAEQRGVQA